MSNQIKILLIEEDPTYDLFIRNILTEEVSLSIFDLRTTRTIEEAKDAISEEKFDVVLLDISSLKDKESNSFSDLYVKAGKTPVIALCELGTKEIAKDLVQKGAKDYFVKRQIDEHTLPLLLIYTVKNKRTEEALQISEKRFKTIIENSSDIITILDVNGIFQYASYSLVRDFNYKQEDLINKNLFDFIHLEDKEKAVQTYSKALEFRDTSHAMQFRFKKSDGTWRNLEAIGRSILDDSGKPICVINCRDITERIKLEEELRRLSLADDLTGLHNRRGFLTLINQQMKLANRNKENILVLFADIDKLKWINDLYGHHHGDIIIQEAAKVFKSTFRDVDIIARLGGDEFAVVLVQAKESGIEIVKKRIQERINVCNMTSDRPYRLSMSVGVVQYNPEQPCTVEDLIAQADKLMYEQKRGKKNYKILLGNHDQQQDVQAD